MESVLLTDHLLPFLMAGASTTNISRCFAPLLHPRDCGFTVVKTCVCGVFFQVLMIRISFIDLCILSF